MTSIQIVAECGINHNGNMTVLREMILRARDCGCTTIKTQLYDSAKLFPSKELWIRDKDWYSEVEKTNLTKEQFFQFVEWCKEVEAEPMASAFDLERLSWLEEAGVERYKVASRCVNDTTLLDALEKTGKEVLASVPYGDLSKTLLSKITNKKLLYCIPEYPCSYQNLHLRKIFRDSDTWNKFSGFSDHTETIYSSMVAIARGATIIERHFCLKRDDSSPDMVCSSEPDELKQLVEFARKVEEIF